MDMSGCEDKRPGKRKITKKDVQEISGHTHTIMSDGLLDIWQSIALHQRLGIKELVVTDHDYITLEDGHPKTLRAKMLGDRIGMKIRSGAEFSCFVEIKSFGLGRDTLSVHIIGKDIGSDNPEMLDLLAGLAKGREERSILILEKIRELNPDQKFKLPERIAKAEGVITTADIAKAVCDLNSGLDFRDFLHLLIKDRKYVVPHDKADARKTIAVINKTGGSVWCHAVRSMRKIGFFGHFEEVADILKGYGLGGIEVFARGQSPEETLIILDYCIKNDLEVCTSGDVHVAEDLMRYIEEIDECFEDEKFLAYLEAINN